MSHEAIDARADIHMAGGLVFVNPAGGDLILKKVGSESSGGFIPLAEHGQLASPREIRWIGHGTKRAAIPSVTRPSAERGQPALWLDSCVAEDRAEHEEAFWVLSEHS